MSLNKCMKKRLLIEETVTPRILEERQIQRLKKTSWRRQYVITRLNSSRKESYSLYSTYAIIDILKACIWIKVIKCYKFTLGESKVQTWQTGVDQALREGHTEMMAVRLAAEIRLWSLHNVHWFSQVQAFAMCSPRMSLPLSSPSSWIHLALSMPSSFSTESHRKSGLEETFKISQV